MTSQPNNRPRFANDRPRFIENREQVAYGLSAPWVAVSLWAQADLFTVSAAFLLPSESVERSLIDLEAHLASIPPAAAREGGAFSLMFEHEQGLIGLIQPQHGLDKPAPSEKPVLDSQGRLERILWSMPYADADAQGVGLCIAFHAILNTTPQADRSKALALASMETLWRSLAASCARRLRLSATPHVAISSGMGMADRHWHGGVPPSIANLWTVLSERSALDLQTTPTRARGSPSL